MAVNHVVEKALLRTQLEQGEMARQQQLNQKQLVMQIVQQIHQSLDLDEILNTAVREVRQLLQTDRVIILRLESPGKGKVIVESVGAGFPSILSREIYDPCFVESYFKYYQDRLVTAKPDIYNAGIDPCHVQLLAQFQVRANLVIPILQGNDLWGLLIAHHCTAPRHWQQEEVDLLQQLAGQMAIAIQQATLVQQLQIELTNRQQAEVTLRESEEKFRQLAENITEAVFWIADYRKRQLLYISPAYETIWGRSCTSLYANFYDWIEAIHPEDQERVKTVVFEQILAGCYDEEYRILRPDGSVRWIRDRGFPLKNQTGEPYRVVGIAEDISECKEIEAKLHQVNQQLEQRVQARTQQLSDRNQQLKQEIAERRRAEEILRLQAQIIDQIHDAVISTDIDGYITSWNKGAERLFGYSVSEAISQHISLLYPGELRSVLEQQVIAPLLKKGEHEVEITVQHKSGEPIDILISLSLLRNREQTPIGMIGYSMNISERQAALRERKQAEKALRQSEKLYRHLVESQTDLIVRIDLQGRFTFANKVAGEVLGFNPDELIGQPMLKFVLPDDWSDAMANMQALTSSPDQLTTREQRGLTVNGVRWFQWQIASIENEEGQVIEIQGVGRDVTERKQTEEALQASETQYRRIVETANEGICCLDALGKTTFVNQQMATMLGYTVNDMLGKSLFEFMDEETQAIALPYWQRHQQGIKEQLDLKLRHRDGSEVWVIVSANPFFDENGQYIGGLGMITDISDRQQAEQKIREQAALLDITTDAILVRDLDHQVLFWNSSAEHLFGWKAEEAIGKKTTELFSKETSPQLEEALNTVFQLGSWQGELHKATKEGKQIILQSRWTLIRDKAGNPKSILTVDTDITEKKQLELQFLRAQRLESIGTLASGIAHDLNNILTPILAIAQLLPIKFPHLDQENRQLLNILEENSKRGADLIKQILSFARGIEGKHTILQVGHLLLDIAKIAQRTFPKSIEIQTVIPTQKLGLVSADATQLHQVFMNLCINARDAMPEGGILAISAENSWVDQSYARINPNAKEGSYIVITVSDTGCGISPEQLERIFDPFFTTKEPGKGTGLGLSTVLGIVKNHRGFVTVSSQVGTGTKFEVYLPTVTGKATPLDVKQELTNGNNEIILFVEDEVNIQKITRKMLERHHYKILVANNGLDAIKIYAQHKDDISIVLMNMMMPTIGGLTAIHALQKINPQVKIIASSGQEMSRNLIKFNGIQAFLPKPYCIKDLLKTIQSVLEK